MMRFALAGKCGRAVTSPGHVSKAIAAQERSERRGANAGGGPPEEFAAGDMTVMLKNRVHQSYFGD